MTSFIAPAVSGADITPRSVSVGSPNTQTAVTGGGDYSAAVRIAGGKPWYDPTHPSFAGGAKGDGVTDDTSAIQAALAAAAVVGGLVLLIMGVYLISALLTIASGVWLQGSGIGGDTFSQTDAGFTSKGTRIVMAANANVDIIQSANFATLTGVGNPDVHTIPERFKVSDLVLDGNNFVQSGGASNGNTATRALVVYGRDYRTDNVVMQNCGGDGWYSESRTVAGYAEESLHSNIRAQYCGGNGLTHKGPHDSQLVNGFFSKCGGSGVQVLSTSGSFRCTNVHIWGCTQYQWDIQNGDTSCSNCTSDGVGTATKVGIRVTASRVQWHGGSIYGSNTQGEALVQLGMGDGGVYTVQGCIFNTVWYNMVLGSVPLRYMSGVDTLTASHNWFGRFTFNNTNTRAVVGAGKTTVTGAQAGNVATLNVGDTSSFPAAGSLYVGAQGSGGSGSSGITYTGKTATTFTGCTGGNAAQTIPDQAVIFEQTGRITNSNRETWWFESGDEGSLVSIQQGFQGANQSFFEGRNLIFSGTIVGSQANSWKLASGIQRGLAAPVYSAAITPNANAGDWQTITVANATAFTINAPSNAPDSAHSQELTIEILNSSGGAMGVITWNAAFVFAGLVWTNPANTKKRFVTFQWNGANWIAIAVATADY